MTSIPLQELTPEQIDWFIEHGWIRLENCFTPDQAEVVSADIWTRLGLSPTDKTTWTKERINMPWHREFDVSQFAPKAWDAICDLVGGESRIAEENRTWKDGAIVNFGTVEGEGKDIHPTQLTGWHVDGDFFVHYLNSPEQGLLVIPLFSDIAPGGGGTMICPEAIPKIANHLYQHPEGVSPRMVPRGESGFSSEKATDWFNNVAKSCSHFVEATGKIGDVYLLHPLMLHSASNNKLRQLRIITNPPVTLREPFNFDREDETKYSVVERATIKALGKDKLKGWKPTMPAEEVIPERIRIFEQMKIEETQRLKASQGVLRGSNVTTVPVES